MNGETFQDKIAQGLGLMSEGRYAAAKECFAEAAELEPKSTEAYRGLGDACANMEEYDEAIANFQKLLLADEKNGEAYYSIGNVWLLKGDKLKAVEYYNKAENRGYASAQMYQIMANIFLDANDMPQTIRSISRAIQKAPFDGELRLFKARIYIMFSRFEEALETLDEMERILPDAFEAYSLRVQIYTGMKRYDEALQCAKKARERFPADMGLAVTQLKALVSADRDEEAEDLLATIRGNQISAELRKDAVIQEATLHIKKQRFSEAYEALSMVNEALGNDADILYLMLDICAKTGKFERVINLSESLMQTDCGDFYLASAMYFHAEALEASGKKDSAMKEYRELTGKLRKMTIRHPDFYEGYLYRLLSHTKLQEYDKALELADFVKELYPEKADGHAFKHFIYKEKGDVELAEKEKEQALQIQPKFPL